YPLKKIRRFKCCHFHSKSEDHTVGNMITCPSIVHGHYIVYFSLKHLVFVNYFKRLLQESAFT
ncbi:hypothetical protein EWB00_004920, partial [Schistosoma japonicum]